MSRLKSPSSTVSDALNTRFSCRAFLDTPVPLDLIQSIVETATRAPSGGNLQPWKMWVVTGEPLKNFVDDIVTKAKENPAGEGSEYHIYPPELTQPYKARRSDIGERMYEILGIPRDDKMGRLAQMFNNYTFFGAPCAMFFAIDKQMQEGQWSDMGMVIQSIMLLAREHGLHTCPQEIWAMWTPTIKQFLDIPDDMMFFCGLAIGHADPEAAINQLVSPRAPMEEVVTYIGD